MQLNNNKKKEIWLLYVCVCFPASNLFGGDIREKGALVKHIKSVKVDKWRRGGEQKRSREI